MSACCTTGGRSRGPRTWNFNIPGLAVLASQFVGRATRVIQPAKAGTVVSSTKRLQYDARLFTNTTVYTNTALAARVRYPFNQHTIMEIVKGLFMDRPRLMTAQYKYIEAEVVNQLYYGAGQPAIPPASASVDVHIRFWQPFRPTSMIQHAVRVMRRGDYDLEVANPTEFWAKQLPGLPAGTPAELQFNRMVLARVMHYRHAQLATAHVQALGKLKAAHPCATYAIPDTQITISRTPAQRNMTLAAALHRLLPKVGKPAPLTRDLLPSLLETPAQPLRLTGPKKSKKAKRAKKAKKAKARR